MKGSHKNTYLFIIYKLTKIDQLEGKNQSKSIYLHKTVNQIFKLKEVGLGDKYLRFGALI